MLNENGCWALSNKPKSGFTAEDIEDWGILVGIGKYVYDDGDFFGGEGVGWENHSGSRCYQMIYPHGTRSEGGYDVRHRMIEYRRSYG